MGDEFEVSVAHFVLARGNFVLPQFALVAFEPGDRVSGGAADAEWPHVYKVSVSTMAEVDPILQTKSRVA